jgi:hypothetical protein
MLINIISCLPQTNLNCHPAALFAIRPVTGQALGQNFVSLHHLISETIHGGYRSASGPFGSSFEAVF